MRSGESSVVRSKVESHISFGVLLSEAALSRNDLIAFGPVSQLCFIAEQYREVLSFICHRQQGCCIFAFLHEGADQFVNETIKVFHITANGGIHKQFLEKMFHSPNGRIRVGCRFDHVIEDSGLH